MTENRFSIWHVIGLIVIGLSVAALSLGGGVFLGYQWGRVAGLATAVAGQPAGQAAGIAQPFAGGTYGAYLGIEYQVVSPALVQSEKLGVTDGALVEAVMAGGPADQAGLQVGDVLTKVDGQVVDTTHDLHSLIKSHKPGDMLTFTVWRSGQTSDHTVTLGSRSNDFNFTFRFDQPRSGSRDQCASGPCPLPSEPPASPTPAPQL